MKKLVIAPSSFHPYLLKKYREDNPFFDVKFLTKGQIINIRFGYINDVEKAIKLLMINFNLTYNNANDVLKFILRISQFSGPFSIYEPYYNLLKNDDLISQNEYGREIFKDKDIEIVGYSCFDQELVEALNYFGLTYSFYKFEGTINPIITCFKTYEESVFHILNTIAFRIDKGENINKFVIVSDDELYNFYLKKYAPTFNLPLNIANNDSLLFNQFTVDLLNIYKNSGNIEDILNVNQDNFDDNMKAIFDLFKNGYDNQLNKEQQLDFWKSQLKKLTPSNTIYQNAIHVSKDLVFDDSKVVFVPLFVQGKFPRSYQDNDFLSDEEKLLCHLNTSLDKGKINDDLSRQFLSFEGTKIISYPSLSYKDAFYPSPFIKMMDLDVKKHELTKGYFSKEMLNFHTTNLMDRFVIYKEINEDYVSLINNNVLDYHKYSNEFTGANVYNQSQYLNYSYSKVKTYYLCPFSYFLGESLKLDHFEGNFNSNLGNFIHSILEHQFDPGFDFDKFFDAEIEKYDFTKREIAITGALKEKIRDAYKANQLHSTNMKDPSFKTEMSCDVNITKKSKLVGKVDKLIVTDNTYVYLVDYKTGSESFVPQLVEFGLSMQLPTYALLTSGLGSYNFMPLKGLFINNLFDSSFNLEVKDDNLIQEKLKLNGIIVGDESIDTFEKFNSKNKGLFVHGVNKDKFGGVTGAAVTDQKSIDELKSTARKLYEEADERIRNNDFEIHPKFVKNKNIDACKYCSFKDICFVKENQKEEIKVEKNKE